MKIKNIIAGASLSVIVAGGNVAGDDSHRPLPIEQHTQETINAVFVLLREDLMLLSEGCADSQLGEDIYTKIIDECLKNYQEGGYLDFDNYNMSELLGGLNEENTIKKPSFRSYTNISWLIHIFEKNPILEKIINRDMELLRDEEILNFFQSIKNGEQNYSSLSEEQKQAYDLFLNMEKFHISLEIAGIYPWAIASLKGVTKMKEIFK